MKKVLIIISLCTAVATTLFGGTKGKKPIKNNDMTTTSTSLRKDVNKPFYRIDFKAGACFFDIKINDISVMSMNMERYFSMTIPVNYLIPESGKQRLSVTVLPNTGETVFDENIIFAMTVQLYDDTGDALKHVEDILEYRIPNDRENMIEYQTTFDVTVPYQLTAWQTSTDLNTVDHLREKLESAYQKVGDMIRQKQYDAIINSMREWEKRIATSMYLGKEESDARMGRLIEDFKNGFEPVPLSGTETMHVYADGKLACLKTEDGESALRFWNKETEEEMTLDMMFHLKKGDVELSIAP